MWSKSAVLLSPLAVPGNVAQICSFALSTGSSRECGSNLDFFSLSIGSSRECGSNLEFLLFPLAVPGNVAQIWNFYSFHWQFQGTWPISAVLLFPGEISDDEGGVANVTVIYRLNGHILNLSFKFFTKRPPAIVLLPFKQQYNYPSETGQAASFPFTRAAPEKNCGPGCSLTPYRDSFSFI